MSPAQKAAFQVGAHLMNGIQQTINGLGETTALFGVQGADKFVETWTGVGKGLEVIAEHPVDTLFINPAMDAYENYSQIYEKGGAGAVVGAVVGDVLSAVPTILSGGALRQIKNIGKHHTEGPGPKPGPKPEPKVYNTEEEFDIIHDVKQTSKAGVDGVATNSASENMILVYRGTDRVTENNIFAETGHLLSNSAQRGYMETGSLSNAYKTSNTTHNQWIDVWGGENHYVEAHAAFGNELESSFGLEKTFMSVTTDPAVAAKFARGGTVYVGYVPESSLIRQTLDGSTESEWLLKHGSNLLKPMSPQD